VKSLSVVLLVIIALGVAYCIRSLRALHQKVSARSERTTREIATSTKALKAEVWQSYRQSEALQQLLSLLKFSAPIPPTRSWAASPDLLLTLAQLVRTHNPKLVVELGSGVSTLVVAKAGAKKVISIDNSEEFAGKTKDMLKEHKVRGVDIRVAELKAHISGVEWYDTAAISDLKRIDC
jgi:predicted O-methyltransferase YrrM